MTSRNAQRSKGRPGISAVLSAVVAFLLVGGGVALFMHGRRGTPPHAAPLPQRPFAVSPLTAKQHAAAEARRIDERSRTTQPPVAGTAGNVPVAGRTQGNAPSTANPGHTSSRPVPGTGTGAGRTSSRSVPGTSCTGSQGPNRIAIPSLGIAAPVLTTGRDSSGDLNIPDDVADVTRWSGSPAVTAATGATLIAGHIDNIDQGAGALYPLHNITPGALICVTDGAGRLTRWAATDLSIHTKADLPADVFAAGSAPARTLYLVTCGGPIEDIPGHGHHYRDNIIATAVPL